MESSTRSLLKPAATLHSESEDTTMSRRDMRKVEGPRVRESRQFIAALNSACAEINKTPNAGTPELIRMGMKMMQITDPDKYLRLVRSAARTTGLSMEEIEQVINQ